MANGGRGKAIHRLRSMYPLRAKVDEAYRKGAEAARAGEPTVWAMLDFYYGDPILRAMSLETLYPENFAAAVAAAGAAPRYLEACEGAGFPTHLCGYSRVGIGYASIMMREQGGRVPPDAPMGGMPKPLFLLASAAICDARYKWFQALGRYLDVPVWVVEAPLPGVKELFLSDAYDRAVRMATEDLRRFVSFVERVAQRKMDWARLEETVETMIELNRVWHETNLLRKARPGPMHSRDFFSAMPAALFMLGDLKDSLRCFQELHAEVEGRVRDRVGAVANERYRVLFAELPPWHSLSLFDRLAERGWNFVVESYGYHPPPPLDLSRVSDPLERIARFNLQYFIGNYPRAHRDGVAAGQICHAYLEYARDWACDGALLHPLVTCRSASTHLPYVADLLMERLEVPSLVAEGDIVDLRLFDVEDTLAKAEAFEETMDHYQEVRREPCAEERS